jgi:hypothetical protein
MIITGLDDLGYKSVLLIPRADLWIDGFTSIFRRRLEERPLPRLDRLRRIKIFRCYAAEVIGHRSTSSM